MHTGLQRLEGLDSKFKEKVQQLLDKLAELDIAVCVVSGLRTIQQQNQLYSQGRTTKGEIVTNARGGSSAHNFGTAVDLAPLDSKGAINWNDHRGFSIIGAEAEKIGLVWGGHFKSIYDAPHVESADWRSMQALWKAGKIEVA